MLRNILAPTITAVLFASPALAAGEPVAHISVTADLAAVDNPAAAEYWSDVSADLSDAILSRIDNRVLDTSDPAPVPDEGETLTETEAQGLTVTVDLDELSLASAYQSAMDLADSELRAHVNVSHPSDNSAYQSFDVAVTVRGAGDATTSTVTSADQSQTMAPGEEAAGVPMEVAYQAMIDAFANEVADNL